MKKVVNNFVKADACSDKAINMAMYNGTEKIKEYENVDNLVVVEPHHLPLESQCFLAPDKSGC